MTGGSVHDEPNPARHLLGRCHLHNCDSPTVQNSGSAFGQRELRIDFVEVLPHQEVDTKILVFFFARLGKENRFANPTMPERFASSMTITFAVRLSLSSSAPRPRHNRP